MNKKILIFSLVFFLGLFLAVYQYAVNLQADFANAYSATKPANGHSWTEMECTEGLCVTASNRVGIGTDNPDKKLSVIGDINASGDICNGAGACLSDLNDFVGSQMLVNGAHTYSDCTTAGGTVFDSDVSLKQCKFNAASCPSGWTQYKSYASLGGNTCCGEGCCGHNTCCTTPITTFSNPPGTSSSCTYAYSSCPWGGGDCIYGSGTCSPIVNSIGCY